jgi:YD repeat-containing protein
MQARKIVLAALPLVVLALHPRVASAAEVCGDGIDNDSDLMADEGCNPSAVTGVCESPLSCRTAGRVAPTSGNVVYTLPPDVAPDVAYGPSLSFQRFYTSLYEPGGGAPAYRKPLGPHWGHNYMSWLDKDTAPSPDQVILHTVTGQDVLFQYASTNGGYDYYTPQEGFEADYLRQSTSSPYQWELRTLTGTVYVYDWASPTGKLTEVRDTLATPNKVTLAYDGSGQVSTVTDASNRKRFLFSYASGVASTLAYQTFDGSTWTTRVTVVYGYTSGNPTSVSIGSKVAQTMQYSGGYLTKVVDGDNKDIISLTYLAATPGKVVRSVSESGELGYEYNSSRGACSGGTVIFFNRVGNATCDSDANCGADHLCGGIANPSSTPAGFCYRAARCLITTSPDEDLVETVTALPVSGGCTGACVKNIEYDWGSTPDLIGEKQADGTWTSYQRNADGLVTLMARGDTDSDPTNAGGHKTWYFYGDANFPGRVTEERRISELKASASPACDAGTTTDCARTLYTWNADGLLAAVQEIGFTFDATGAIVSYSYTTSHTYDARGRITLSDGPLAGSNDVIEYTYWSSSDLLKDGYPKEVKRKKDSSNYLVDTTDSYNYWGSATSRQEPDGTLTCATFDADRGTLTESRVAMASQTSCSIVNSADLRTAYEYDPRLRLTKTKNPFGDCILREYDSAGRLWKVKERDDCNPLSSGNTLIYTYSSAGVPSDSLVTLVEYLDESGIVRREQEYTYHDSRHPASVINPVNKAYSRAYTYTADGTLAQVDFEAGIGRSLWLPDALDRVDEFRRYKTSSTFDAWTFDYAAQLPSPSQVADGDSKAVQSFSDDLGREAKVVSPDSGTTLKVHDAAGRVVTIVEADGTAGETTHIFTYDNLGRMLTADYGTENCGSGQPVDITYAYDAAPVSCPVGATCARQAGRLAYARSTLLCSTSYADKTLDQETFYSYDDAGRAVQEYIRDDAGRIATQAYAWTKNGRLSQVTSPSGVQTNWLYNELGNTDANKIGALMRDGNAVAASVKWLPFGPIMQYSQMNATTGSFGLLWQVGAYLTWNKAYRPSKVEYANGIVTTDFSVTYEEDLKGRTTALDYSATAIPDRHLTYDWLDRITCDATTAGTCPTSGPTLRSNMNGTPAYTASNDRTQMVHYHPSTGTRAYSYTLKPGRDQIDYFITSPATGTTTFTWDHRGNRSGEASDYYAEAWRSYTYDGRSNVRQISGEVFDAIAGEWTTYTLTNAYDHKGRRVFKSYSQGGYNPYTAQWFFYYDTEDRLIEVKHTPNIASSSIYSLYQFHWMETRPIAYWQTDYPSVTTSRRYLYSDAGDKVLEAWTWPTSGAATKVWSLSPDAFGWDEIVAGASVYQPLRGDRSRAYHDPETVVYDYPTSTVIRPALDCVVAVYYDPLTGSLLQAGDTLAEESYTPPAGAVARSRLDGSGGCSVCEYVPRADDCYRACVDSWGCEGHGCSGIPGGGGSSHWGNEGRGGGLGGGGSWNGGAGGGDCAGLGEWGGHYGCYGWENTGGPANQLPGDLNRDGILGNECLEANQIGNCADDDDDSSDPPLQSCSKLASDSVKLRCRRLIVANCEIYRFETDPTYTQCEECNEIRQEMVDNRCLFTSPPPAP